MAAIQSASGFGRKKAEEEEESPAKRNRFAGTPQQLASVMEPWAASVGKSFIRYPSEGKVADAKVAPEQCLKHKDLLSKLRELQPNLGFTKVTAETAMRIIAAKHCKKWGLDHHELEDWVTTLSGRLRNMCSVVAKETSRKKCRRGC